MRKIKSLNQEKNINPSIYFPFAEDEKKIHVQESCYLDWQQENAIYNNGGKVCSAPYHRALPYLKTSIDWMWYLLDAPGEYQKCDFSLFNDLELYFLLRERAELALVIPWKNMKQEYKNLLLAYHPELAENITGKAGVCYILSVAEIFRQQLASGIGRTSGICPVL